MNIQARIIARKVLFSYVYEHLLAYYTAQKEGVPLRLFFVSGEESTATETTNSVATLAENADVEYCLSRCNYIIQQFFSYPTPPAVDMPYIEAIGARIFSYWPELQTLINTHTTTFHIDMMDIVDQAIFLLGYAERKILETPKEVLLNEMIELGKRYGDDGSAKLLNGILHKVFSV